MRLIDFRPAANRKRGIIAGRGLDLIPPGSTPVLPVLSALTLSANTLLEDSAPGTLVAAVLGATSGSALSLSANAGNRFILSGTNILAGAVSSDFESASSHSITVRETLAGATNTPRDTSFTVNVINVNEQPNLSALTLSSSAATQGTATTINIVGATAGSTVTAAVPDGMALNSAARTISGTPTTAGTYNFTLTETLGDSANSPRASNVTVTVAAAVPAIASVDPEGWSGQWNTDFGALPAYSVNATEFDPGGAGQISALSTVPAIDANGNETFVSVPIIITKRVRNTWTAAGAHLTGQGNKVAFNRHILQGEILPGGRPNNSTRTGYRPVANHLIRNHRVVGDLAYVQVAAAHWSGKNKQPVAGVRAWYRSVDGTKSTAKVTLSGLKVLPGGNDQGHAVVGYDGYIPVATWSDGSVIADGTLIIREVEVDPHYGTIAANRLTTVGGTVDGRGFTPQTDYKHTARATTPVHTTVVASGGLDETVNAAGVGTTSGLQRVSTDIAVARANPFATQTSAYHALKAATNLTGGFTDGCYINHRAGTHTQGATTNVGTYQVGGEVIMRTDPIDAAYSAVINCTGYMSFRQSWIRFEKLSLVKTISASGVSGAGRIVDCKLDCGNFNSAFMNGGIWVDGIEVTNAPANAAVLLHASASSPMMRGIKATSIQIDTHNLAGSRLVNCGLNMAARNFSGTMVNGVSNIGAGFTVASGDGAATVEGVALINVICTNVTTTSTVLMSNSRDSQTFDIRHFVRWGLTELGSGDAGRRNEAYDETAGTVRRMFEFWDERSVTACATYTKEGWFYGANLGGSEAECALRTGSWAHKYGVGRLGVLHVSEPNANTGPNFGPGGSENHAFFGLKIKQMPGRNSPYQLFDCKFAGGMQKSTWWNGTALQPGTLTAVAEDFKLNADSPCIGVMTDAETPIGFDIFGEVRDRGSLGAAR